MNSTQSYFLISLLLITALIAIICLLILATDQPDAFIEGQRRIVLSPKDHSQQKPTTQANIEESVRQQESLNFEVPNSTLTSTTNAKIPIEVSLEKLAEFGPISGGKFMSISIMIDKNLKEKLFLAKNDGQIEIHELNSNNGTFGNFHTIKLPVNIYRFRPLNSTFAIILDAIFSRLQLWNLDKVKLKSEIELEHPAKYIVLEGEKVFALGRFEGRIDLFDISNGQIKPMNSSFHIGQHCQSLARTGQSSLLLPCPSGLLEISAKNGQIIKNIEKIEGINSISALQVLSSANNGNHILAASGLRREMLMIEWSGRLKARMRIVKEEQRKGIWLWTGLAMYRDKIYALEYFGNRVEIFKFDNSLI